MRPREAHATITGKILLILIDRKVEDVGCAGSANRTGRHETVFTRLHIRRWNNAIHSWTDAFCLERDHRLGVRAAGRAGKTDRADDRLAMILLSLQLDQRKLAGIGNRLSAEARFSEPRRFLLEIEAKKQGGRQPIGYWHAAQV